jgi:hypothetical protein
MKILHILFVSVLVAGSCLPGYANQASSAYKHGVKAEMQNDYDRAFEAFKKAHQAKPLETRPMVISRLCESSIRQSEA